MKSFWASIGIFGALVGLIIWNSIYIHRVCDELSCDALALPSCAEGGEALAVFKERWEQESRYIELSVSHHSTNKINDCLAEWESAAKVGEEAEYERCRHLFLSLIAQILSTESASIRNWI